MSILTGKVVAITGASSGIGRALAEALVARGAKVAVGARRFDRLTELADQLGPDSVLPVALDVTDPADNRAFVDKAVATYGRLDAFVANAGLGAYGGILDLTDAEVAHMIDVNYTGTVWGVRAAVPHLFDGGGDIVIVASVAGLRGGGNEAVYAGTKSAQVGLSGAIDRELRERDIRVSAVCPAAVSTEFAIGAGRTEGMPWLDTVLQPQDVATAIVGVLEQPRRVRTNLVSLWSMAESS